MLDLVVNFGVMLIPIGVAFLFLSFQITDKLFSILLFAISYFFIIIGIMLLANAFYRAQKEEKENKKQVQKLYKKLDVIIENLKSLNKDIKNERNNNKPD